MADLRSICRPVSSELARASRTVSRALADAVRLCGCPPGAADGGKMLRPALLLMTARLFNLAPPLAVRLAADVQLVHAASLIHDDVIDAADVRRGHPTLAGALGPADAVLLGDVIFTGAFNDIVSLGLPRISSEFARTARLVCAGEVRQNRARGDFAVSRTRYLKTLELKSASLFRACALLPAMAAGACGPMLAAAARFGRAFGLAFQIADDLLDVAGDPKKTGKPAGADLAQGKVTLPLINYLAALGPSRRKIIRRGLSAGDEACRRLVLARLRRPSAAAAVVKVAARYCSLAVAELALLPDAPEKTNLAALCRFAVTRSY